MAKAWIDNNAVRDVCPVGLDPVFLYGEEIGANYSTDVPDDAKHGWVLIGGVWQAPQPVTTPPAPPTVEQFVAAMDANFDAKAREKNYDSRITCALRAGYAGPFQAEGIAFAQWVDNSYAAAHQILAAVQAGQRPAPESTAALLAELPQFDWANV